MKKRILSLVLAMLMCLGTVTAFAETNGTPVIGADDVTDPEMQEKIWTLTLEELDEIEAERAPIPEMSYTLKQLIAMASLAERKAAIETMLTTDAIAQYRFYVHFSEDVDKPRSEEVLYPVVAADLWNADEIVQAISARDLEKCKAAVPDLVKVLVKSEKSVKASEALIMTDAKLADRYAYHLAITLKLIDAYGHELECRGAYASSCTTAGSTGNYYCAVCDEIVIPAEALPLEAHDYVNGSCAVCGASESPFTDVTSDKYFFAPVLWASEKGITGGYPDGTFRPQNTCTRAQVVTFIWRANGCPEPQGTAQGFKDVAEGTYYYKAVLWAAEKGITGGFDDGGFHPDETVTRAQAMTFMWRAADKPAAPEGAVNTFKDVTEANYYYDAVLWAVANGITGGYDSTTFGSMDGCTRAQIVTFLYRLLAA